MHQHFRRYCFHLAEKLGMTVQTLLKSMDSAEIAEWMAYDTTCSTEWQEKYNAKLELERSKELSDQETLLAFKALLGGQ